MGQAGQSKSMLGELPHAPKGSASVHLDALRGFAAFSVLLSHWRDAFFVDYSALQRHDLLTTTAYIFCSMGRQWVIVFFVLSGYLVGGSILRSRQAGRWSWRAYLLTRLTRLYVVLVPALLLGGIADWVGMHMPGMMNIYTGNSGMHILAYDVHQTLTPRVFVENLLFLQNLHAPGLGSNTALWSLANEFWYYIVFPLLLLVFARGQKRTGRVVCVLALVAWSVFAGMHVVLLIIPWLMGVSIACLPRFPAFGPWTRNLTVFLAMAMFFAGMMFFAEGQATGNASHSLLAGSIYGMPFTDIPLGLLISFLIWVTLSCATAPMPSSYAWLAKRAAAGSYTLYLIHIPVLVLIKASLHIPRMVPNWHAAMVGMAVLVFVLLYAQLVYELFEKKTDGVRNWIRLHVMVEKKASSCLPLKPL